MLKVSDTTSSKRHAKVRHILDLFIDYRGSDIPHYHL